MKNKTTAPMPKDLLREAREAKGFETATDAARHYGWTVATYLGHENGNRNISKAAAAEYARVFGVAAARLLGIASINVRDAEPSTTVTLAGVQLGAWLDQSIDRDRNNAHAMQRAAGGSGSVYAKDSGNSRREDVSHPRTR